MARPEDDTEHEFEDYENLAKKSPFLCLVLVTGIASLAGIPPFAGFIGKLLLMSVAFETELYISLGAMIIGVVISIYYYFGWIREVCFHPRPVFEDDETRHDSWKSVDKLGLLKPVLIALVISSVVLGIW